MKKSLIAVSGALAIMSAVGTQALAAEVGIIATHDYAERGHNAGGFSVGKTFDKVGVTAIVERASIGQDRFSIVADYPLTKVGSVSISPRAGVAYLANRTEHDGYALTAGVEASIPLDDRMKLGIAVDHQAGQSEVKSFNGNRVTAAIKYSF